MSEFTHLHLHTQYSILDGAANIKALMEKARTIGLKNLAITDHGNMFGVMEFVKTATDKDFGIKPIIGCEVYVANGSRFDKRGKQDRSGHHLILLAKNFKGYQNLVKLVTKGYKEGFYYTPRIDKDLLSQYNEGLIASSACLGGEIPDTILRLGKDAAKAVVQSYLDIFGNDFYFELQRHGLEKQDVVNKILIELSAEMGVKLIATNDVHYINEEDYEAHHILICLNTNQDIEVDKEKGLRYTGQEYLKTPEQMQKLFADIPEAITNIAEVVGKIEEYKITRKVILPVFPLPESFTDENDYLVHLTYEGAAKKYSELTAELKERLDFELASIKTAGFAGYFLIVQDFINQARRMGVLVGPGRGSAAGSAVAYCIGITDIDPLRYNLLFERFLNPERISLPDIDIDFDDAGRELVLDYVINKYGENRVAQIVTFGTMAARLAIRDVARVLKLPLSEADRIAKLVPEGSQANLRNLISDVPELKEIRDNGDELARLTLRYAQILEGSNRHTGTHACGVIIGPDDLIDYVPLSTAKDSKLMVTQYEGKYVEEAGMLKMDFLGLKTLTIIKDTCENIRRSTGIVVNMDEIPFDDEETYQLFQQGLTIGIFQFESDGMRTYLRQLKPTNIEDLIAMNALYRPGPMDFIPQYIARKVGREKIEYPHPLLEPVLKNTYGIMVYQEQIMQTAQIIGGFSLGKADILRRAMGKKMVDEMHKMKEEFIAGAASKGIARDKADNIFYIMEKFAHYGFNRSHSAAYSVLAYQTAYLKAHYPASYMAAVLAHNMQDMKNVNFYISECNRMDIQVLGPDINLSSFAFSVNSEKVIRFGLGAIKGVGEAAVSAIIDERENKGAFKDIFDFTSRVNLRTVNKKTIESLATAGAFDSFEGMHRAQYFYTDEKEGVSFIDKAIKFGNQFKELKDSLQFSLFGEKELMHINPPDIPKCDPLPKFEILRLEKEYIGFYISGHPLDSYKIELEHFCNTKIDLLQGQLHRNVSFAGMVRECQVKTSKQGSRFASFIVEDYNDSIQLQLFKESFLKFQHFLVPGNILYIKGKVEKHFRNEDDITINISEIKLLEEIRSLMLKEVTIKIVLGDLDQAFTGNIEKIAHSFPGNCPLMLEVSTDDSRLALKMTAERYRINPTNEFFHQLEKIPSIRYKIN